MLSNQELINKIKSYNPKIDENLISKAYELSQFAHRDQRRYSGELYFVHPVAVAEILINLKLDQDSIIAGLLHDVVEDTDITIDEIEKEFGNDIACLVDGVTKLGQINSIPSSERVAENFRKLTVAMSKDIRVLLVKLADRYHNMQTISHVKSLERRISKAQESIDIYAPLAARIGLNDIKDELYDMGFAVIDPEARNKIKDNLKEIATENKNIIEQIIKDLSKLLQENNFEFKIFGRQKTPYSIYNKMRSRNIDFYNLHDIMAFRIITTNVTECYRALGVLNSCYNMIPGTFKDYISTPKENGYQSIHLATLGPLNKKIELQIRDKSMHKVAESGLAAHWYYKESHSSKKGDAKKIREQEEYRWISDLISLFEYSHKSSEVLKGHKLHIHDDEVFCFTPNGDIFNLPKNSSVIDFAYAIHSEVGNSCISAKVNGAISQLRRKLENGDQIEIITSKSGKPSANWLNFVVTSKARSAIRSFIRNKKFNEYKNLGQAIITKFYASKKIKISDKILLNVINKLGRKSIDDLYVAISQGIISRYDVLKLTHPEFKETSHEKKIKSYAFNRMNPESSFRLPVEGLIDGMSIYFAKCCNPIPGDMISGVINTGTGVAVHNRDCKTLNSMAILPQRLVDLSWRDDDMFSQASYDVKLNILLENKSDSLADITNILTNKSVNIGNIKINNQSQDFFELIISIKIRDRSQLQDILSALRISKNVHEVKRI